MFNSLPPKTDELQGWTWAQFEPYYRDLEKRPLDAGNLAGWLQDWTSVTACLTELYNRLYVATTVNTADKTAKARLEAYLDGIYPPAMQAEQALKQKLLASGLKVPGMEVPMRLMHMQIDLFRKENLPLLAEEQKLSAHFSEIVGAQTVEWEGRETTITQLRLVYYETDREKRERAWRMKKQRQLADRGAINALWQELLAVRMKIAANAGKPDYRAYRWQQLLRSDYTPDDCKSFQDAIEEVAVPALARINERRRQRLGVSALRPWDLDVDPLGRPALAPFKDVAELTAGASRIFHQVDPQLGDYFDSLQRESLLDLGNRKNKADGAYCTDFAAIRKPFIFANAVGTHEDVQATLHESGHAFHVLEESHLPYFQQLINGNEYFTEFCEVASMGMELLASPYLAREKGGFYSRQDAARAQIKHLEKNIWFWPYMAVVDAFQHWVYENPSKAMEPANCDAQWTALWRRFIPGVDWNGLEEELATGWHRKLHIHQIPFYYVEYGFAQLGATQVWGNALKDQAGAVARYRKALSLGGTKPLPELFAAAGGKLAYDAGTLREAVQLTERVIGELEKTGARE
jgi:oligoendopeptidase F